MDWCYYGNKIKELSHQDLSGMHIGYMRFSSFIWNRAKEIITSKDGNLILTTIKYLFHGQNNINFSNLDGLILTIGSPALKYTKKIFKGFADANINDIQKAYNIQHYLGQLQINNDTFINEVKEMREKFDAKLAIQNIMQFQ
ncbi:hypothetical protein SteCoe_10910 [Stentor coeruleus]|uniref:Uncharacterized protein n=1 Tax=Stentor coeruleus TaxID=5963 RepID=A0A1R2CEG7_9CILI|nr:hypothetical protein SteCoe_10910 [Stentor coeruleus]